MTAPLGSIFAPLLDWNLPYNGDLLDWCVEALQGIDVLPVKSSRQYTISDGGAVLVEAPEGIWQVLVLI